ncbi:MAG: mechanosensitive ion channel, partial [Bacteroidales bacterium]|nr:mechanosensitive ion channel [Bacteroidales bacterium]
DEKEFPDAVKERIDQIITDIDLLSLEVKEHLDAILAYETVLDLQSTTLAAYLEECGHSYEKSHTLDFLQTHPPVWVSFENEEPEETFGYHVKTIFKETVKGINDLWITNKVTIIIHLISLIIIFLIILAIRKIVRRWEEKDTDNIFVKILSMPFSIAFLITVFMTFYIYPSITVYVLRFSGLLIILPLSRLAIGVLNKKFHWLIYAFVIIYLLNWLILSLFFEVVAAPRFYVLLEILVALLLISWWIRPQSPIFHSKQAKHGKYILFLAIPSLLVLFTAFITNLFGYVDFSFELASSIVRSLALAMLFYIIVMFLEGVFLFFLKDRSGKRRSSVEEYGGKLERRINSIIRLVAIIYWLSFTLDFFYIKDEVLEGIRNFLNTKWVVGEMTIALKGILLFILVIFITIWLIKFIRLILEKEIYPRAKLSRGVPAIISLILNYSIATLGFLLALAIVGIDLTSLTVMAGAIGVGIGFGLQDLFNNLVSGFILVFERPVHVGDVVKFANMEGKVESIGIRSSTIRIWDGTEVIVPNGKIISNELINLTLSDQLMRLDLELGVAYGTDPHSVIDILTYTATMHPDVIKSPKPFAIFLGYGESAIKFKLFFWASIEERMRIKSEVTLDVSDAMKNSNITIPYPQQDVHVKIIEKPD